MDTSTLIAEDVVTLRPVVPEDLEVLLAVYDAGRGRELDQVGWLPGQRDAFVRMQFQAQDRHYRANHRHASFDLIEVGGRAAGRLTVDRAENDMRVVDLALLPEFRGRGIGGMLLGRILGEAAANARTVSIHVEVHNPAARLYERLGFRPVAHLGVYRLLRWEASGEDRLVPVGLDRDQEEGPVPDGGVVDVPRALDQPLRTSEKEGELSAAVPIGSDAPQVRAYGHLIEHEGESVAARQSDQKRLTDEPGEVVMGEPVHASTVAAPLAPRSI